AASDRIPLPKISGARRCLGLGATTRGAEPNLRRSSLTNTKVFVICVMAKRALPTDAELAILGVLWRRGPSTVREVHDELSPSRGTGYTTVLKLMQLMAQKGLVVRDEAQRSHVYRPASAEAQTQRRLLGDLMDKAFA